MESKKSDEFKTHGIRPEDDLANAQFDIDFSDIREDLIEGEYKSDDMMGQSEANTNAMIEDIMRNLPDEAMSQNELIESLLSILDILSVKHDDEEVKKTLKEKLGSLEKKKFEKKDLSALLKDYI